jgi:PAS domain-containing protein
MSPMKSAAAPGDWAATVEAIVRRAPASASQPHDLRTQVRLLALLSSAAPLNTLLEGLATYVETWAEGLQCAVLLVDPTGRVLVPAAAPSLPPAFAKAVPQVPIIEGHGSCGTAAARRELVIVDDIEHSPLWVHYAALVLPHGLKACWSMPVFDDSRALLGTLALYYRRPRAPSTREIELIQFASSLAAFVIQRHRDAERLRTSESRLEAAVWGTNIGLWEANVAGEVCWFDDWCERCDIDPCNGAGGLERWHANIHPDDVEAYVFGNPPHWYETSSNYTTEYRVRNRSGEWRWIHERGKVTIRNSDGSPQLFSGVCIDIDARKQTEAALRRAEDRYELAINAARLPVWEYDVAADAFTGNSYWHSVLGYDLSEAQARERTDRWLSDIHPGDHAALKGVTSGDAADSAGFYEYEFRVRAASGDYKWLMDAR